jgi:multisubunit Na+/H+ antiporter MnhE subunit
VRHARAIAAWWVALFFLWILLVGQWNRVELLAAVSAAFVAACAAEAGRAHAGVGARVPFSLLAQAAMVPVMVVADFGVLAWALVRRRRGVFRTKQSSVSREGPGARAVAALLATYSPNAYVVEFDVDRGTVLVHDLVPWSRSESPV